MTTPRFNSTDRLEQFEAYATRSLVWRLEAGQDLKAAVSQLRGWKMRWTRGWTKSGLYTAEQIKAAWLRAQAAAQASINPPPTAQQAAIPTSTGEAVMTTTTVSLPLTDPSTKSVEVLTWNTARPLERCGFATCSQGALFQVYRQDVYDGFWKQACPAHLVAAVHEVSALAPGAQPHGPWQVRERSIHVSTCPYADYTPAEMWAAYCCRSDESWHTAPVQPSDHSHCLEGLCACRPAADASDWATGDTVHNDLGLAEVISAPTQNNPRCTSCGNLLAWRGGDVCLNCETGPAPARTGTATASIFVRIHREHEPNGPSQVVRLCPHHLTMARDCLMVLDDNAPVLDSTCFCPTCHFCDDLGGR